MQITNQKKMAAQLLKCGVNRVWINPSYLDQVAQSVQKEDIREAIDNGWIKAKAVQGTSRVRALKRQNQKKKGGFAKDGFNAGKQGPCRHCGGKNHDKKNSKLSENKFEQNHDDCAARTVHQGQACRYKNGRTVTQQSCHDAKSSPADR